MEGCVDEHYTEHEKPNGTLNRMVQVLVMEFSEKLSACVTTLEVVENAYDPKGTELRRSQAFNVT